MDALLIWPARLVLIDSMAERVGCWMILVRPIPGRDTPKLIIITSVYDASNYQLFGARTGAISDDTIGRFDNDTIKTVSLDLQGAAQI